MSDTDPTTYRRKTVVIDKVMWEAPEAVVDHITELEAWRDQVRALAHDWPELRAALKALAAGLQPVAQDAAPQKEEGEPPL